jgi:Methyltransferase FkbM domain
MWSDAVRQPVSQSRCDVIDCHGPDEGEIDFLKTDVEGWEAGVIASGDWTRRRPRCCLF